MGEKFYGGPGEKDAEQDLFYDMMKPMLMLGQSLQFVTPTVKTQ